MSKYFPTIGLEIHAELKTKSKMFCGCANISSLAESDADYKPNFYICPVCMAHPGTLPVANKQAIEHMIKIGLAIDGTIADFSEFDRKNYFYPDIPKAYQISQYKYPIVSGGKLAGVDITRVHLEEDTATSTHSKDGSLVDFNRAGVPLMELVTEPVIKDTEEILHFARELQLLLRYLGVSDANMELGQMRVEVNVSVSPSEKDMAKNYVEVKNINSFQAAKRAAEYEIKRQSELWDEGRQDEIVKETRGWDESKQKTFSQRSKENAEDYRYFPDPDLPKMYLHKAFDIEKIRESLPELPEEKRARYKSDYGIKDEDIESYIVDMDLANWFEEVSHILSEKSKIQTASNFITSDYLGIKKSNSDAKLPSAENFAELVNMFTAGDISSRVAKDILARIVLADESPRVIATAENLIQKNDEGALKEIAQKIIDANPQVVATYKGGKENALMSLVGKIMQETKGSANPKIIIKLLKESLDK